MFVQGLKLPLFDDFERFFEDVKFLDIPDDYSHLIGHLLIKSHDNVSISKMKGIADLFLSIFPDEFEYKVPDFISTNDVLTSLKNYLGDDLMRCIVDHFYRKCLFRPHLRPSKKLNDRPIRISETKWDDYCQLNKTSNDPFSKLEVEIIETNEQLTSSPNTAVSSVSTMTIHVSKSEAQTQFPSIRIPFAKLPSSVTLIQNVRSHLFGHEFITLTENQFQSKMFHDDESYQRRYVTYIYDLDTFAVELDLATQYPQAMTLEHLCNDKDTIAKMVMLFLFGPYFKLKKIFHRDKLCLALKEHYLYELCDHINGMNVNNLLSFDASTFFDIKILPSIAETLNAVTITYYGLLGLEITPFRKLPVCQQLITARKNWIEHFCAYSILFSRFLLLIAIQFDPNQFSHVRLNDSVVNTLIEIMKRNHEKRRLLTVSFALKYRDIIIEWAAGILDEM
ncbi:hypothetical protein PCE1_004863 [Barthelona sp. PCE]